MTYWSDIYLKMIISDLVTSLRLIGNKSTVACFFLVVGYVLLGVLDGVLIWEISSLASGDRNLTISWVTTLLFFSFGLKVLLLHRELAFRKTASIELGVRLVSNYLNTKNSPKIDGQRLVSDLLQRLPNIPNYVLQAVVTGLTCCAILVVYCVLLIIFLPLQALWFFVGASIFLGIAAAVFLNKAGRSGRYVSSAQNQVTSVAEAIFDSKCSVIASGRAGFLVSKFSHAFAKLLDLQLAIGLRSLLPKYFLEFFSLFSVISIAVWSKGEALVDLGVAGFILYRALPYASSLASASVTMRGYLSSTVGAIVASEERLSKYPVCRPVVTHRKLSEGEVRFDRVKTVFQSQQSRPVTLSLKRGDKIHLIGASGIGKSSLLKAITGVVPLSEGSIEIFNENSTYSVEHVDQLPFVFEGTLLENLLLGRESSQDLSRAAETYLTKFRLHQKLDSVIQPDTLSGGERQRVALIRALLAKPDLLLLDESTSAMNKELALKVFDELDCFDGAIILVSHSTDLPLSFKKVILQ